VGWSAGRKEEVVLRLLRGDALDLLARERGQPAGRISAQREDFLAAYPTSSGGCVWVLVVSAAELAGAIVGVTGLDRGRYLGASGELSELERGALAHALAGWSTAKPPGGSGYRAGAPTTPCNGRNES
jgi:hypothetical protein